jgi:tetratricopeptide (TPR) repeat protein
MNNRTIKTKYFLCSLIFIIMLVVPVVGQDGDGQDGTTSPFTEFGFGARAMGLGNAYTAIAADPTAVYWNPAGLDYIYQQSLTFFHASLYVGTNYDFLGYAYPTLDIGTFSLGIARLGVDDIIERSTSIAQEGTFSFETYRAYLGYGLRLPWDLAVGASLKIERSAFSYIQVYDDKVTTVGVGMDLGFMYRPTFSTNPILMDWSLGLNIHNIFSPQLKHGDQPDALPLDIRFGISRAIYLGRGGSELNFILDLNKNAEKDVHFAFGSEFSFRKMGKARVGYSGSTGVQFGVGIEYSMFEIDYAYGNPSTDGLLDPVHRISFTFNFGINRDEMYAIVEEIRRREEERIIENIREADRQKLIAEHMGKADEFYTGARFLDAIVEYQQVISADPFNQKAKIRLDSSNVLLDRQVEEQRNMAVLAAIDKDRAEADARFIQEHYDKGRFLLDKSQYMEAQIEFNLVLERDPDNQPAQDAIITTRRRMGDDINGLVRQARREFKTQNYSEALRLLSEARLLSMDNPQVKKEVDTFVQRVKLQENIQQGLLLYDIGEYENALEVFGNVLEEDPSNQLIKQYYTKSKIEALGETEKMDAETEGRYIKGIEEYMAGRYAEAIAVWQEILKDHPYNKRILEAISGAEERMKRQSE